MAEEKNQKKKISAEKKAVADQPKTAKAAVKPSPKNAAAKKTSAVTAAPNKTKSAEETRKVTKTAAKKKSPTAIATSKPTPEERYRMVETAAYFIAEQHGFEGRSDEHWIADERQITKLLGQ